MDCKSNLHVKYAYGWLVRIVVVLFSMVTTRLINGTGYEFYAAFMIVMALINLAPIFERGIGFYTQNKMSSITLKAIAHNKFSKIFKSWSYSSIVYLLLVFIGIFLFRDYINAMEAFQDVVVTGYESETLVVIGCLCAFLLAGNNIIQKGMLGLGCDYIAISIQAIPYVVSGLSVLLLVTFFNDLSVWILVIYFLFFTLSLLLVIGGFLTCFPIKSTEASQGEERTGASKFSSYTLLGVLILTSETLFAAMYLDSESLANYGILQRVYLSILLITSVVNQINWSKYTKEYFSSSSIAIKKLVKNLAFQIFVVMLFLAFALMYRNYWMDFFHVKTILALKIHVLFSIAVLARVILEGVATFYLATNRIVLMLVVVVFQFIFMILSILYFNNLLDLFYLSAIQAGSFTVSLLLAVMLSKTRLGKIYE